MTYTFDWWLFLNTSDTSALYTCGSCHITSRLFMRLPGCYQNLSTWSTYIRCRDGALVFISISTSGRSFSWIFTWKCVAAVLFRSPIVGVIRQLARLLVGQWTWIGEWFRSVDSSNHTPMARTIAIHIHTRMALDIRYGVLVTLFLPYTSWFELKNATKLAYHLPISKINLE